MDTPPLTRRQPFKGLYVAYLLTSVLFVRLPWWCIRYLPRSNRPRPSWPLYRCIVVAAHREVLTTLALKLGIDTSHAPPKSDDELKNARFVRIDGISEDSELFCGEIRRAVGLYYMREGVQDPPVRTSESESWQEALERHRAGSHNRNHCLAQYSHLFVHHLFRPKNLHGYSCYTQV